MSIEIIETIIKMDSGEMTVKKGLFDDKDCFYVYLICRFGTLKAVCKHLDEGITQVCRMYQTLEEGSISVTTIPF